ncbi:MAG: DinB family protein [Nocardioides sp.]
MVERTRPVDDADEPTTLSSMLDFLRATVVMKVEDLSDEQAYATPVPPSTLTLAGVVKHLSATERFWFSIDFAGLDLPWPYPDGDPSGNFPLEEGDTLDALVEDYQRECARSRASVAGAGLDDMATGVDMTFNLRYAFTHMIEETARHCGHLDLLREVTDGRTGQ